jgi:16S rRNA (cytosine1402-N4)-methyltransferase
VGHTAVLQQEAIDLLAPIDGGIYVDGTLGLGGHARKILEECGPQGKVIGFDKDIEALALARHNLKGYGDRIMYLHRNFAEIAEGLSELKIAKVDGLLLDLGLSSLQLEGSGRGFSFKGNEPLDMRMDVSGPRTAANLLNTEDEDELADIFYYYGEERHARKIAARVVEQRRTKQFETTDQLADLVAQAIPKRFQPKKIHVATKVFQALRIAVNNEMDNLARILDDAPGILKTGGRLCIISFHSLEDRMVKKKFRDNQGLKILTKKPITPTESERRQNPRARSAKLRAAEFIGPPDLTVRNESSSRTPR